MLIDSFIYSNLLSKLFSVAATWQSQLDDCLPVWVGIPYFNLALFSPVMDIFSNRRHSTAWVQLVMSFAFLVNCYSPRKMSPVHFQHLLVNGCIRQGLDAAHPSKWTSRKRGEDSDMLQGELKSNFADFYILSVLRHIPAFSLPTSLTKGRVQNPVRTK